MSEEAKAVGQDTAPQSNEAESEASTLAPASPVSLTLSQANLAHESMGFDHLGIEIIQVTPDLFISVAKYLFDQGFNYLRCQSGYDSGPGEALVSVYHLVKVENGVTQPEEIQIKVFLPRDNPRLPSVYWLWKTADWQERETYDMYGIVYEGHPNLTRILMPEDWVGWPMRKDYISPDFYELQDAY